MRRLLLIVAVVALTAGIWFVADEQGFRQKLGAFGDAVAERTGGGDAPSWGDVADKVGAFAEEERDLKTTVGGIGAGPEPDDAGMPDTVAED